MVCRYIIDGSDIVRLSNRSDVKVYMFQKQKQQNISRRYTTADNYFSLCKIYFKVYCVSRNLEGKL